MPESKDGERPTAANSESPAVPLPAVTGATAGVADAASSSDAPAEHRHRDHHRGLGPPQFSVASLLAVMTLFAVVLALSDVIGAYGTFWLVDFLVAVFAHAAGNVLGNRLRDHGSRHVGSAQAPAAQRQVEFAPRTRLGEHHRASHWVLFATCVGAIASAAGGGYWLLMTLGEQFTVGTMLVALIAFAVLGGIWSFLAVGFVYVLAGAWRQSSKHK